MTADQTIVLNATQVRQKIDRIAFQIYEQNYNEKEIVLAGIDGNGYRLTKLLADRLTHISDLQVQLVKITVNKRDPLSSEAIASISVSDLQDRSVVLVDDVINSGKTLIHGVNFLLRVRLKSLQTVALIDRDHKRYPIKADYVGLLLSTTLKEHVSVMLEEEMAVYLN